MTIKKELDAYCQRAVEAGATHAIATEPSRIVTAPWVAWRCQFGCPDYKKTYCCPPYTATPEETRKVLDIYNRTILFHLQWTKGVQKGREIMNFFQNVVDMERELFLDGFYRAFCMLAGPCLLCRDKECALFENRPCRFPEKARPSMEALGIDVYQSAHNHGFPLSPLRSEDETRNIYSLLLVD